jgi:rhamnogalacturonyl hydrolase YesR
MQKIVGRPDGLYRHQASTDAAWGRGNGFPALGLALTLTDFPRNHPDYPALLAAFQKHMKALSAFQDENGMFREVIDYPGAYPEYSGTSMIATAMMRGIRKGWLDASIYQPIVDRAWQAILIRTAADGRLFDVAESTGTRGLTLKDYLRRAAILDNDPRGGAFANDSCDGDRRHRRGVLVVVLRFGMLASGLLGEITCRPIAESLPALK